MENNLQLVLGYKGYVHRWKDPRLDETVTESDLHFSLEVRAPTEELGTGTRLFKIPLPVLRLSERKGTFSMEEDGSECPQKELREAQFSRLFLDLLNNGSYQTSSISLRLLTMPTTSLSLLTFEVFADGYGEFKGCHPCTREDLEGLLKEGLDKIRDSAEEMRRVFI